MGGALSFRTAAANPARIAAVGSFHGGNGMVTKNPDSPHLLIAKTNATYLVCQAQNDDAQQPTVKDDLKAAFTAAQQDSVGRGLSRRSRLVRARKRRLQPGRSRTGLVESRYAIQDTAGIELAVERLAGAEGIEPSNAGIKIQCLTTWRRPNLWSGGGPYRGGFSLSTRRKCPKSAWKVPKFQGFWSVAGAGGHRYKGAPARQAIISRPASESSSAW